MTRIPALTVAAGNESEAELVAVGCFQRETPQGAPLPPPGRRAVLEVSARPGFKARDDQMGQASGGVPGAEGQPAAPAALTPGAPVVAVYGLGAAGELSFGKLCRWLGRVADDARLGGVRRLAIALPAHGETTGEAAARRLARVALLAAYRFEQFRNEPEGGEREEILLLPPPGGAAVYQAVVGEAEKVAAAVAYARDIANTPGNVAGPEWMEAQARALAGSPGREGPRPA